MVDSGPVNFISILSKRSLQFSPTPTDQTPGCLSSAIRRPEINARYSTLGGLLLDSQSTKVSTLVCSLFLSSPNFKIHPCKASESVPPGTDLPEFFCATDLTVSSVMSLIKVNITF